MVKGLTGWPSDLSDRFLLRQVLWIQISLVTTLRVIHKCPFYICCIFLIQDLSLKINLHKYVTFLWGINACS